MSAELAYGRKMGQLEKGENAPLLDTFWQLNFFITINRISSKFPLLSPLKYFFVPLKVLLSHFRIERLNREAVGDRVAHRHEPHPLDHFDSMLPPEAPVPVGREKLHLEILAGHLLIDGFESVSGQYHCALMFLLLQPELLQALVDEVRTTFDKFEGIDADSLVSLPFLNAVMNETFRMTANVAAIIPCESPGATVDGNYIPKGIIVHFAHFAFTRSPRYFHDGRSFRPQRWLPKEHSLYDTVFENDATENFHPFGRGPRSCIAMAQGLRQLRLYLTKVSWGAGSRVSTRSRSQLRTRLPTLCDVGETRDARAVPSRECLEEESDSRNKRRPSFAVQAYTAGQGACMGMIIGGSRGRCR